MRKASFKKQLFCLITVMELFAGILLAGCETAVTPTVEEVNDPTFYRGNTVPDEIVSEILSLDNLEWVDEPEAATFIIHGAEDGRRGTPSMLRPCLFMP